jgi:hypothetical protein
MTKKHTTHRDRPSKELNGVKSPREQRKEFQTAKPAKPETGNDTPPEGSPAIPVLDLPVPSGEPTERDKFQASKVKKSREKKSVGAQSPRLKEKAREGEEASPTEEMAGQPRAAPKKAKSSREKPKEALPGLVLPKEGQKDGERVRSPKSPRHAGSQSERNDRDTALTSSKDAKDANEKSPSASPRSPRVGRESPLRRTKSVTTRERVPMADEQPAEKPKRVKENETLSESNPAADSTTTASTTTSQPEKESMPIAPEPDANTAVPSQEPHSLPEREPLAEEPSKASPQPQSEPALVDATGDRMHLPGLPSLPQAHEEQNACASAIAAPELLSVPVVAVTEASEATVARTSSSREQNSNAPSDASMPNVAKEKTDVQPISTPLGASGKREASPRSFSSLKSLPAPKPARQGTDDLRTFVSASPRMPVQQILDKPRSQNAGSQASTHVNATATPSVVLSIVDAPSAASTSESTTTASSTSKEIADLGTTPVLHRLSFMDKLKLFQELSNRDGSQEKEREARPMPRHFANRPGSNTHLGVCGDRLNAHFFCFCFGIKWFSCIVYCFCCCFVCLYVFFFFFFFFCFLLIF